MTSAQVLLTFFDMSARTHYLNARQTLRRLLDWRVVPVINENDTTTTDEISFGDNDFLAAQVAILIGADLLVLLTDIEGLYTADPRTRRRRPRWSTRSTTLDALDGHGHRPHDVAARLGRDALEGRRGRDGDRGGDPGRDLQRPATRRARRPCWRASRRARASPAQRGALLVVQAVAAATPSPRTGRVVVDAGAARALREGGTSLLPVGSSTCAAASTRATPSRSRRGRARSSARASPTTRRPSCAGSWA